MRVFHVYILTSRTGTLYVGMTNNLSRRIDQHKRKLVPGFTARYECSRLAWYEGFPTAMQAIAAEKRIKGWTRAKKVALVESKNPKWDDLATEMLFRLLHQKMRAELTERQSELGGIHLDQRDSSLRSE